MVSSCFSVGKKWNHLESCGLLSSLAGDVSNSETGWAVEVCSFYPLHARHSVGPEESYEDESEEDEVSNKGGDWIKNILGLEQPNMSNTYQQMNTHEGLHNWSNLSSYHPSLVYCSRENNAGMILEFLAVNSSAVLSSSFRMCVM